MKRKILAALAAIAVVTLAMACATASGSGSAAPAKEICPPEIKGEALYIPFPVKITLDGKLDDWAGIPMVFVDKGSPASKDPAEDGSFNVAAASDGDKLYVVMTVKDKNIISGKHKADWWNEDSAEFYLNLGKDLAASKYTKDACQINLKPVDIGKAGALTITGTNADKFKVEGIVFKTADGWGFEASVEIADRVTPEHGLKIGFQAQLNGAATKDRNVKLIWSLADTNDSSWKDPSLFGRGIFYKVGSTDKPLP